MFHSDSTRVAVAVGRGGDQHDDHAHPEREEQQAEREVLARLLLAPERRVHLHRTVRRDCALAAAAAAALLGGLVVIDGHWLGLHLGRHPLEPLRRSAGGSGGSQLRCPPAPRCRPESLAVSTEGTAVVLRQ